MTSCGGEGEVEGRVRVYQKGWGGGHRLGNEEVWGKGPERRLEEKNSVGGRSEIEI